MKFKKGDLIVYIKPDGCEIGKIKRIREEDHHGFVWFHTGDTILNDYCNEELIKK